MDLKSQVQRKNCMSDALELKKNDLRILWGACYDSTKRLYDLSWLEIREGWRMKCSCGGGLWQSSMQKHTYFCIADSDCDKTWKLVEVKEEWGTRPFHCATSPTALPPTCQTSPSGFDTNYSSPCLKKCMNWKLQPHMSNQTHQRTTFAVTALATTIGLPTARHWRKSHEIPVRRLGSLAQQENKGRIDKTYLWITYE